MRDIIQLRCRDAELAVSRANAKFDVRGTMNFWDNGTKRGTLLDAIFTCPNAVPR